MHGVCIFMFPKQQCIPRPFRSAGPLNHALREQGAKFASQRCARNWHEAQQLGRRRAFDVFERLEDLPACVGLHRPNGDRDLRCGGRACDGTKQQLRDARQAFFDAAMRVCFHADRLSTSTPYFARHDSRNGEI